MQDHDGTIFDEIDSVATLLRYRAGRAARDTAEEAAYRELRDRDAPEFGGSLMWGLGSACMRDWTDQQFSRTAEQIVLAAHERRDEVVLRDGEGRRRIDNPPF